MQTAWPESQAPGAGRVRECGGENETGQTLDGSGHSYAGPERGHAGEGGQGYAEAWFGLGRAMLGWGEHGVTVLLWWAGGV